MGGLLTLGIGDVIAVHHRGLPGDLIELGDAIAGKPALATHVIVVHHQDAAGRWWGIQGEPGGVGWVDLASLPTSMFVTWDNTNHAQPRTVAQRAAIAALCEGLLHVKYDWVGGIAVDGLDDIHLEQLGALVDKWWGWGTGPAPGHVVCSSMPAWAHSQLGLARPKGNAETIQPADWWAFNADQGWLP